jgi:hypothetical protein
MKEPVCDLSLNNDQKYLILESGEKEELKIKVYENNRVYKQPLKVILETYEHPKSPIVAWWTTDKTTSENGFLTCSIQARDLENSEEIEDPVSGKDDKGKIRGKIHGDLPWDRYYGNYISLKIESNEKSIIKLNIPVRVLHRVQLEKLKENMHELDKEKIQEVVTKMLSYYTRYYPWLHVNYAYTGLPPKLAYEQFLKIREFLNFISKEDIDHWHTVQHSIFNINHFLDRLIREDNDWKKMPRSRDFPFNGVDFLKMWKATIIDQTIKAINEKKENILKSETTDVEIDIDDWENMQDLINKIDIAIKRPSAEDKKLFIMWKLQIFDQIIEQLNILKNQTRHSHTH